MLYLVVLKLTNTNLFVFTDKIEGKPVGVCCYIRGEKTEEKKTIIHTSDQSKRV